MVVLRKVDMVYYEWWLSWWYGMIWPGMMVVWNDMAWYAGGMEWAKIRVESVCADWHWAP